MAEDLKMVCTCGGKVAFPPECVGQLVNCPHCDTPLVLQRPIRPPMRLWAASWDALKAFVMFAGLSIGCWFFGQLNSDESGWLIRGFGGLGYVAAFLFGVFAIISPLFIFQEQLKQSNHGRLASGIDGVLMAIMGVVMLIVICIILFVLDGCNAI